MVGAHPQVGVLMLTMIEDPGSVDAALTAGRAWLREILRLTARGCTT